MVRLANVEIIAAMVLISLAIVGVTYLISDLLYGPTAAVTITVAVFVAISVLWWGVPLARGRRSSALPSADVHPHPNGRSRDVRTNLHQVAELVDQPHTPTARYPRGWLDSTNQMSKHEVTSIRDLAHH